MFDDFKMLPFMVAVRHLDTYKSTTQPTVKRFWKCSESLSLDHIPTHFCGGDLYPSFQILLPFYPPLLDGWVWIQIQTSGGCLSQNGVLKPSTTKTRRVLQKTCASVFFHDTYKSTTQPTVKRFWKCSESLSLDHIPTHFCGGDLYPSFQILLPFYPPHCFAQKARHF